MAAKTTPTTNLLQDCDAAGESQSVIATHQHKKHHQNLANTTPQALDLNAKDIDLNCNFTSMADDVEPEIDGGASLPFDDMTDKGYESEPTVEPLPISRSLSDKFSRSTPVLFLRNHGHRMLGSYQPALEDGRGPQWTNWVVGLSCFCFLFPSFTILICGGWNTTRPCSLFDAVYFGIVSVCSFLGDYVYCYHPNPPLPFGTIDIWTATGGVVIAFLVIVINPWSLMVQLMNMGMLACAMFLIARSRKADNAEQWRMRHCTWHLFAGLTLAWLYAQEYMLHRQLIPQHEMWWPL